MNSLKNTLSFAQLPSAHFSLMLEFCKNELNFNLRAYNPASVERRLLKMMSTFRVYTLPDLITNLQGRPMAKSIFIDYFSVNYTQLFREPHSLKKLVTVLARNLKQKLNLSIWMIGCSTGHEVVSLVILLKEQGLLNQVKICASDISQRALLTAKEIKLSASEIDLAQDYYIKSGGLLTLKHYCTKVGNLYHFDRQLLEEIVYFEHDILEDPLLSNFDVIWTKNLLIYFQHAYQAQVLRKIDANLTKEGILCLGEQESLFFSDLKPYYSALDENARIYKKI